MSTQLCVCKTPPRFLLDGIAVCNCRQLVWRQASEGLPTFRPSFEVTQPIWAAAGVGDTPMEVYSQWAISVEPRTRARIVREAKRLLGNPRSLARQNIVDAIDAARLAGAHDTADEIELDQWVARLEE